MKRNQLLISYFVALVAVATSTWLYFGLNLEAFKEFYGTASKLVYSWLQTNQIIQTFTFGSIGSYLVYCVHFAYRQIYHRVYAMYRTDLTIRNTDPSYNAVVDYITEKFLATKTGAKSSMQASTKKKAESWKEWRASFSGVGEKKPAEIELRPNDDAAFHNFIYKGHEITFFRKKGETMTVGYERTPLTLEEVSLSMWGRNTHVLTELLHDCLEAAMIKKSEGVSIFVQGNSWLGGWEKALVKKPRAVNSVIFDVDNADILIEDANKFLKSGEWYSSMGIPFHRGYLLYGPPGCGKTSFALVLAGELKLDVCILNVTQEGLSDNSLAALLREAPDNAMILLEDVDAIFVERAAGKEKTSVSFSGLLNAIDGIAAQEGRIFFITTNHIERLDSALVRPGRCDFKLEVKKASKLQLEKMFLRFFPNEEELAEQFKNRLPADEISMAQLQGHFLENVTSPLQCLEHVPDLLRSVRSQATPEKTTFDYLRAVGLEQYAAALETLGIYHQKDFVKQKVSVDDITNVCPELKLDLEAMKRLQLLISRDEVFIKEQYSVADTSIVRELFLAAYPTIHEVEHGEQPPVLRRQSSSQGMTTTGNLYQEVNVEQLLADFASGDVFITSNQLDAAVLDKLSRYLSDLISKGGKSLVSFYQVNSLLAAYPNRPIQCVLAAKELVKQDRPVDTYRMKKMSSFQFVKQAGAVCDFHAVNKAAPGSDGFIQALFVLLKANGASLNIRCDNKDRLDAILTKSTPPTPDLLAFQLLSRKRIIWEFLAHYRSNTSIEEQETGPYYEAKLEKLAFQFASGLSDALGNGMVSLLELQEFFRLEEVKDKPEMAMAQMDPHLLNPEKPDQPAARPEPERKEWVYEWLASGFTSDAHAGLAEKYGEMFVRQGLGSKEDWLVGPLLEDLVLKDVVGIEGLGHRMKITQMHRVLLQESNDVSR